MAAQIRPTRLDVTDRFPMVAFKIRADAATSQAEVAIGVDPALFVPNGKRNRSAANFYSTRGNGSVRFQGGEAQFTIPPEVLIRFIGNEKLYFGLATAGVDGTMKVAVMPSESSPYISIRGLSGRSMSRVRVLPNRQQRAAGYGRNGQAQLEWAGDAPLPGMTTVADGADGGSAIGEKANGAGTPAAAPYDDGFGPMPDTTTAEAAPLSTPSAKGLAGEPASEREYPAEPSAKTAHRPARRPIDNGRVSHAMVVGLEDRQKVRKYARDYVDLFKWSPAPSLVREIDGRGFSVQTLDAAIGDLNLDFYKVKITRFPSGWDAPRLLTQFIRNVNSFLDSGKTSFAPYDDVDAQKLASSNPLGTVFELDMFGPDNAAIVISDVKPQFYAVTTIHTPRTGDHPVSGHRQFGYFVLDGVTTFYRGADRATLGFPGTESLIFAGAEMLWESFQRKLAAFINDNGGEAEILEPFSERFNATAVRQELGGFDVSQGLETSRTMSTEAFTVNWDEVELIAQPTNFSCWAAAGAMLVGWRDRISLTPDAVAEACKRSTARGLLTDDNARFAAEMGFVAVPPVCYSEEGFRALLENNGPLWVSEGIPPNLHAIIVTGMYSDGSNTFVRIADPWDRAVGSPGKPGAYASTHVTGSRYIMSWDEFAQQYEAAITGIPPNRQILHSGNPNGLTPNTGQSAPPPGYAQAYLRQKATSRGLAGGESFTINWDEVQQVGQPTDVSCWATAASVVLGWRDRMSLTVEGIAERAGLITATGLDPTKVGQFAIDMGMTAEPPQSYTLEAFRALLANNGPLWVGAAVPGLHAIVVTGLFSDGAETYVRITDPWDRDIGAVGAPGAYSTTHATGSRYIMRWADFVTEYESAATDFAQVNLQILHCGGTHGHVANTGAGTPPGYAMAVDDGTPPSDSDVTVFPPPPPRARALDAIGTVSAIGGLLPQVLSDSSGDVSWELDQFRGLKHPNDKAPTKPAAFTDAPTIRLDDWPKLALYGIDDIYAWFTVDWQHNGTSLGNVRIGNIATNDARGMKLKVRAQIMDDNILYEPGGVAALRVRFHYRFSRLVGDDIIAMTDLQLFGDGTHLRDGKWLQKSTI